MTEADALARARAIAEAQGWPFLDPVSAVFRKRWLRRGGTWTIHTHVGSMSAQVGIIIDDLTGEIIEKRYLNLPR